MLLFIGLSKFRSGQNAKMTRPLPLCRDVFPLTSSGQCKAHLDMGLSGSNKSPARVLFDASLSLSQMLLECGEGWDMDLFSIHLFRTLTAGRNGPEVGVGLVFRTGGEPQPGAEAEYIRARAEKHGFVAWKPYAAVQPPRFVSHLDVPSLEFPEEALRDFIGDRFFQIEIWVLRFGDGTEAPVLLAIRGHEMKAFDLRTGGEIDATEPRRNRPAAVG